MEKIQSLVTSTTNIKDLKKKKLKSACQIYDPDIKL